MFFRIHKDFAKIYFAKRTQCNTARRTDLIVRHSSKYTRTVHKPSSIFARNSTSAVDIVRFDSCKKKEIK